MSPVEVNIFLCGKVFLLAGKIRNKRGALYVSIHPVLFIRGKLNLKLVIAILSWHYLSVDLEWCNKAEIASAIPIYGAAFIPGEILLLRTHPATTTTVSASYITHPSNSCTWIKGVCAEKNVHLDAIVHLCLKNQAIFFAALLNQKVCVKSAQLPFQD